VTFSTGLVADWTLAGPLLVSFLVGRALRKTKRRTRRLVRTVALVGVLLAIGVVPASQHLLAPFFLGLATTVSLSGKKGRSRRHKKSRHQSTPVTSG
jgi:predicted branched-subunit amino acid permease